MCHACPPTNTYAPRAASLTAYSLKYAQLKAEAKASVDDLSKKLLHWQAADLTTPMEEDDEDGENGN